MQYVLWGEYQPQTQEFGLYYLPWTGNEQALTQCKAMVEHMPKKDVSYTFSLDLKHTYDAENIRFVTERLASNPAWKMRAVRVNGTITLPAEWQLASVTERMRQWQEGQIQRYFL